MTINGNNFTGLTGASAVKFGGSNATSYTVNSATQIVATAPPGAGTVDVTVTTPGGTSATSTADQFTYIAAPIAEYRFDETSGSTVTDSSGNNLSGALNGGVTVGGSGKLCTGYNFNGSNAFVSVPNTALLNPTKITVAAWVRHNTATIKNWEAIVTKGDTAYRMHLNGGCSINNNNTLGGISFAVNGGCAGADVNSGFVPVAGTWYHVVGTYDGTTISIYVNGALKASSPYSVALSTVNTSPLYIGENAQQTGRFFSGDIDEVKIYGVALTAAQISAGYTNEIAGKNWDGTARVCAATGSDHYELSLPSTSITCLPTTVTVTACKDISPCNPMTTLSGKTALLATNAGALSATTVTFNALGVASTTLSYPAANDGAVATVTLSGEQVTASNARKYCPDGANCVAGNSGPTTFKTAGFIFSTAADAAEATFSSQTAGVDFGPYWLRAVKTDLTTKACEAALTAAHPVNFNYQCLDPASCSSGSWLKIGSSSMASSGATVNLAFDANGSASLGNVNFADVGQIKINASATAGGATLIGSTKEAVGSHFVVKPYSLVLTDIKQTASPNLVNPAAANANGGVFVRAGEAFSAKVTSVNASCSANLGTYTLLSNIPSSCITPNYGKEATPETVTLSNALVSGGFSNNPSLNNPAAFSSFPYGSGTANGTTFSWDEVGIIQLTPAIGDGSYLGAGAVSVPTQTGKVGRFYPDHFGIIGSVVTRSDLLPATGSTFTYMDEPMKLTLTVTAYGRKDETTALQNYAGNFAKLDAGTLGSADLSKWTCTSGTQCMGLAAVFGSTPLTSRLVIDTTSTNSAIPSNTTTPGGATLGWSGGSSYFTLYSKFRRRATIPDGDANPDGPYGDGSTSFLKIGGKPLDSDGVTLPPSPSTDTTHCVNLDVTTGTDDAACNLGSTQANLRRKFQTPTTVRFGRLRLISGQGSELASFKMQTEVQYWDGTYWRTNTDDSLTAYASGNFGIVPGGTTGTTAGTAIGIKQGYGSLLLTKPTIAGKETICLDMAPSSDILRAHNCAASSPASLDYLSGNWNVLSLSSFIYDPSATVLFGGANSNSRGNWGFLYRRENF